MADLLMVFIFLAFFLLSCGLVELLERVRNLSK